MMDPNGGYLIRQSQEYPLKPSSDTTKVISLCWGMTGCRDLIFRNRKNKATISCKKICKSLRAFDEEEVVQDTRCHWSHTAEFRGMQLALPKTGSPGIPVVGYEVL